MAYKNRSVVSYRGRRRGYSYYPAAYRVGAAAGKSVGSWIRRRFFSSGASSRANSGGGVKRRFAGSKSGYKRRRYTKTGGAIQSGVNGVSFSSFARRGKMYPSQSRLIRDGIMKVNTIIDTARKEWNTKQQGVWTDTFMSASSIGTLFSSVSLSDVGVGNSRIVVKSHMARICFTNQSNANVVMTIYDIDQRRDVASTTDDATPESAWTTGLAQQALGTGSDAFTINNTGVTPFQSQDFCYSYRVRRVTKVYMELGKSHVHSVYNMCPKTLNTRMLDTSGVQTIGFKNITTSVMVVFTGMPVNDETTVTNIAMGSGAVDIVVQEKITWNYSSQDMQGRFYYDDNQANITTEFLMNEEKGDPDAYTEA